MKQKKIDLSNNQTDVAFGFTNNNERDDNIKDLLTIEVNFTNQKNKNNSTIIPFRPCNYSDFRHFNQYEIKRSLFKLQIQDLNCIDEQYLSENSPQGFYTDDIFTYYEITVKLNTNNKTTNLTDINAFRT